MKRQKMHNSTCFVGQPAPCPGYFANDTLPCVCGVRGNILYALSQVALPMVPILAEPVTEMRVLPLSA
jgi:hypothetical protein